MGPRESQAVWRPLVQHVAETLALALAAAVLALPLILPFA